MLPRLVCHFKKPLPTNSFCRMRMLLFLLSLLADVWAASHSQAPVGGGSVALLDNYHKMKNPGIPLDENTKRALRLTVELGCRNYVYHHSIERYESGAIASRVYFSNLEGALQMFFPGCKIADFDDIQKHSYMSFNAPPYVITTVGKYGKGFYTDILSPLIWIRLDPSQPKASAHLREFVERNSDRINLLLRVELKSRQHKNTTTRPYRPAQGGLPAPSS